MNEQDLRDAIAARAAGEEFPGVKSLDRELAASEVARTELAELEGICGLIRNATPAPSAVRRAQALGRPARSRWPAFAAAAVLLTAAGVAAVTGIAKLREKGTTVPVAREVKDPARSTVEELLAELEPAKTAGSLLGERDVQASRGSPMGGDAGGPPEVAWLRPVAAQAGIPALRPTRLPGNARLVRACIIRSAAGGSLADALWMRYAGKNVEFVLVQVHPSARTWLDALPLPAGWLRAVEERDGLLVLAASPSCDLPALRKILLHLAPLQK